MLPKLEEHVHENAGHGVVHVLRSGEVENAVPIGEEGRPVAGHSGEEV